MTSATRAPSAVPTILGVAFTLLAWGSAYTFITAALPAFGPGPLAVSRFGCATLTLVALAAARRELAPLERQDWPLLVGVSIPGITLYHLLLNTGQLVVPPGTSAFLIQTAPIFTALFASRFAGERVTAQMWLGIAIAGIGAVLLVRASGGEVALTSGALLILTSAVSTAVYFVFSRRLVLKYGPLRTTTWTAIVGTAPLMWFAPEAARRWMDPDTSRLVLLDVIWLGVVPGAICYVLWMSAIARFGATRVMPWLYVSPLIAVGTEWAYVGHPPNLGTIAAGAVVLTGVVVLNAGKRPA